jgi:outer membrane protein TolC
MSAWPPRARAWAILQGAAIVGVVAGLTFAPCATPAGVVDDGAERDPYTVDLPTVLRLAGARNLDVEIAREKVAEAEAEHEGAVLQFFPWLTVGASYTRHDGRIQDTEGDILTVSKQAYAPGGTLVGQWELGEAIYRKLAAKQVEQAARFGLEAQRQASVAESAQGYFALLLAQAAIGIANEAVRIATSYEMQVRSAVDAGVAFKGDALRVTVQAERNRLALREAAERRRVAAARLAQTLHLDPSVELVGREAELAPVRLVDPAESLPDLVARAVRSAPALRRSEALLEAARHDRDGSVYGPWVPALGASAYLGGFGGGRNGDTGSFGDREDYVVGLGWRLGRGGLFDFPRQRAAEARLSSAEHELERVRDETARRVVEAFERLRSQSEQIETARSALRSAEEGLDLARQRREFGVGVVLEHIAAERDLTRARTDYLSVIAALNAAQYRLLDAIGAVPNAPASPPEHADAPVQTSRDTTTMEEKR